MAHKGGKYTLAEGAIVAFVESLGKLASQEALRTMVRDAGAIAPLVALLVSGTGNVPGMAASVLRDLALHSGNRTAILESDGVAQLVRMLHNESKVIASEAADALRSLAANNLPVCKVVRENGGIKMLVRLAKEGLQSEAATQATGALSNIAEADTTSQQEIGDEGGVDVLVSLLEQGFDETAAAKRREKNDNWALSKASEETSRALLRLAGHSSCVKRMLDAGSIAHLVKLLLRAGLQSPAASHAASILVLLLNQHPSEAMAQTLDALQLARRDESVSLSSLGWSQAFPDLRALLHAAAEKKLVAVEEGTSSAAIQAAIEIGRAVEMPSERLDNARANFDEVQAKRRREKMASAAEERRVRKEEERQRQLEREAAEAPAAAEQQGGRVTRKAALPPPTAAMVKRAEMLSHKAAEGTLKTPEEQKLAAEAATVTAMQGMSPILRERMLRRMVREGHLLPGATGILAEYATALGLLDGDGNVSSRTGNPAKLAGSMAGDEEEEEARRAARAAEKVGSLLIPSDPF